MNQTFIVNTITAWDEPHRARHQFTFAAARKIRIVFVARNKVGFGKLRFSEPEENITLIEPYFPVDYRFRYRLPGINEFYQNWLFRELRKVIPDVPVVNFDFTATRLKHYFSKRIYYCNDEFVGNSKYRNKFVDNYIARCEREVAGDSIFCVTTALYLTNKLRAMNPNTFEIPLGVSAPGDLPEGFRLDKQKEKIVVGLMGVISHRHFSFEAINKIAEDDRFKVVLIGPVETQSLKKLTVPEKIKTTGILKGKELSDELSKLDVGLALYNMERVNPGTTPNKLWQYLSVGKPVVVSDLPNLKSMHFPDQSVYITRGDDDMAERILKAFHENTEDLVKSRIDFAKQNTWDHRFEQFMSVYEKLVQ